jgi:hypothetical protein
MDLMMRKVRLQLFGWLKYLRWATIILLVLIGFSSGSDAIAAGWAKKKLSPDKKSLRVIYGGSLRSSIAPCG